MANHFKVAVNMINQYHVKLIEKVENGFYMYGKFVARYPGYIILFSLIFAILTTIPLMIGNDSVEASFDGNQFISESSEFGKNSKLVSQKTDDMELKLSAGTRVMIVTKSADGNLLTVKNFELIRQVHEFVHNFSSTSNITYDDLCLRNSKVNDIRSSASRIKKTPSELKMMRDLFPYPSICEALNYFKSQKKSVGCSEYTPLRSLTKQMVIDTRNNEMLDRILSNDSLILERINNYERSMLDNNVANHSSVEAIGGVFRDNEGDIKGARATLSVYFMKGEKQMNKSERSLQKEFQKELKDALISNFQSVMEEAALEIIVIHGAKEENGDPMRHDQSLLAFGGLLVVMHLVISFSKFNTIEQRIGLGFCGLLSIGLSIVSMNGLGKLFGLPLNVIQTLVMVILVGIGADDMFVVVQSIKSTNPRNVEGSRDMYGQSKRTKISSEELIEWIGVAIRHAGGSIFMTSLTDCLAFGIGGLSAIPMLKDTCLFASIGVFLLFLYMTTFFVGFLTLDQMRIEDKRDGLICCIKKSDEWKPTELCSTNAWQSNFISNYIDIILKTPTKILIIIIALTNLGVSIYGATQLKANFDPEMYNANHEVAKMKRNIEKHFPSVLGMTANLYLLNVTNLHEKLDDIDEMIGNLTASLSHNNRPVKNAALEEVEVDSFIPSFKDFINDKKNLTHHPIGKSKYVLKDEEEFHSFLTEFLFTPGIGLKPEWIKSFEFSTNESLECGQKAPRIASMNFQIKNLQGYPLSRNLSKIEEAQGIIDSYNLGGKVFLYVKRYPIFFVISILKAEVFRNVILAMLAVFVCTELVLCNLLSCLIVSLNIFVGLVTVCGYLNLIGMDLDIVSAMFITIAQGITVDYSAHIVHSFMKTSGNSREERIKKSMVDIGPAVFNGGVSTFAGFFFCAFGRIPITIVIFKIFSLVVISGLFGAFLIIPVVLSMFGPENRSPHKVDQAQVIDVAPANENQGYVDDENESQPGEAEVDDETDVQEMSENLNSLNQDSDYPNDNIKTQEARAISSNEMRRRVMKSNPSISTENENSKSHEMETVPPNYVPNCS